MGTTLRRVGLLPVAACCLPACWRPGPSEQCERQKRKKRFAYEPFFVGESAYCLLLPAVCLPVGNLGPDLEPQGSDLEPQASWLPRLLAP